MKKIVLILFALVLAVGIALATISTEVTRKDYSGNGSTTIFPYTFKIYAKTDLLVIVRDASGNETPQTVDSDYTVSGVGVGSGGNVTFTTAPASTETILILRNRPLKQETSYSATGPFPAASHENALDELTMLVQQLQEQLNRTPHVKKTETGTDFEISDVTAGEYLRWNLAGDGIDSVDQIADLGGFLQTGVGTVERTAASKMGDILHASDFGVIAGDASDDSTALQAAINAAETAAGRVIELPTGTILLETGLVNDNHGVILRGQGMAATIIQTSGSIVGLTIDATSQDITYWGIENLRFDGNSQTSSHLLHLDGTTNTVRQGFIRNVRFSESGADAIRMTNQVWSIDIENPYIVTATGVGINMPTGSNTSLIKIKGGRINGCTYGVDALGVNALSIAGTGFEEHTSGGVRVRGGDGLTITDACYFESNNGNPDIVLGDASNAQEAVKITGNYINGYDAGGNGTYGIHATNTTGLQISGNKIRNHLTYGIQVEADCGEFWIFANEYDESNWANILSTDGFVEQTNDTLLVGRTYLPSGTATMGNATNPWHVFGPNNIRRLRTKTGNYTCGVDDHTIIASGNGTTITLPENAPSGTKYTIKRVDAANAIVVSRQTADTIDGAVTKSLNTDYAFITVESDGANWHIIAQEGTVA